VIVIALAVANTRQVKLSWIVGTSHASLVWIILVAAVLRTPLALGHAVGRRGEADGEGRCRQPSSPV